MAFRGGIASKLGNEYEQKWAVRKLLQVIGGKANAIRYEGVPEEFRGFEFALNLPDCVEWHQTKINAPNGNWTLNALEKTGVMEAFKRRLSTDDAARCVFVSQDPSSQMREICKKARKANDLQEFWESTSKRDRETFDNLLKMWDVDKGDALRWLRRCEFRTESELSIDEAIDDHGRHLFKGDADVFASLSTYLISNLNARITTEIARERIRNSSTLRFRIDALEPTLREDVETANEVYLHSYAPFGVARQQIPRAEAKDVLAEVQKPGGPSLILLTGEAGCGKSGVVREVMTGLKESAVPHLAFRIDRHLSCQSKKELSTAVLGRDESPVSVIENLADGKNPVLIIDQIDAVSEVSGRTGELKDILFNLIRETQHYGGVRCLLVCRSFDLQNDPRYRELERVHKAKRVEVKRLSWDDDVAPTLTLNKVSAELFNESERDLLCLPLNLAVFLEIGDPNIGFSTGTSLMEELLKKKTRDLRRDRNIGWNVQDPLCAMAEWMSEKQALSCPVAVLDDYDGAVDWLSSEGIIVNDRHLLAFFHEGFFDFIFARSFALSGDELVKFLTSTEQHLFRRTQVRQILTAMRDMDRPRYLKALADVLTNCKNRFHIKHAVAQWLGTVHEATSEELEIIQSLDDGAEEFPILMRRALFVSDSWFDLLNEGGQLSRMLEDGSPPRRRCVLWWLADIVDTRPVAIASAIRRWWRNDPSRTRELTSRFRLWHRIPNNPELTALLRDVICSRHDSGSEQDDLMGRMSLLRPIWDTEPGAAMGVVKELFAQWFEVNPDGHPFKYLSGPVGNVGELSEVVKKTPEVFLDAMIPILVRSAEIDSKDDTYSSRIRIRHDPDAVGGPDALLTLYRDAFCKLAATSPKEAEDRLARIDPKLHKVMTHLHLETIRANPEDLGHRLKGLLDGPHLFVAGPEDAEWKSLAVAARSALRANRVSVKLLEERVLRHCPELREASEVMSMIRANGEDESWFVTKHRVSELLGRAGQVQWHVLRTIGSELLSSCGKKRLAELQRKFPPDRAKAPRRSVNGVVESPVPRSATEKLTDDQWLAAIKKYNQHNADVGPGNETIAGGALELAHELEGVTRSDPGRFARLFLRLPEGANSIYGQRLLQGLAVAKQLDEHAEIAVLRAAHAHPGRPFEMEFIELVKRHPACGRDDEVFNVLLWYAAHGDVQEISASNEIDHPGKCPTINDLLKANRKLYLKGSNSTRCAAWQALGQVVAHQPDRAADFWALFEYHAATEISNSVRAMMLYALARLYNVDRDRFRLCLIHLIKPIAGLRDENTALKPLATTAGVKLSSVIERDFPSLAVELIERMIDSSDWTLRLVGVWWALAERLRRGNTTDRFKGIEQESPAHANLWVSILCEVAAHTEYRSMAIMELKRLFSHDAPEVRNTAAGVFRQIPESELPAFSSLAKAFIRSETFTDGEDNADEVIRYLENTPHDVTELVLEASEIIVRDCGDSDSSSYYGIDDLLRQEYRNSENRPDLRKRILDVIDEMAAKNLIGVDKLMGMDDRQS